VGSVVANAVERSMPDPYFTVDRTRDWLMRSPMISESIIEKSISTIYLKPLSEPEAVSFTPPPTPTPG
jgi:hypothetical protein